MHDPDAFAPLGEITDFKGERRLVARDFDCLAVPAMTLPPAGVRDLEKRIAAYWTALARYRLRTLDLEDHGIHEDTARAELATIPGLGLRLIDADWNEVASRLEAMKPYGGYHELRKLSALLFAGEIPATEATT